VPQGQLERFRALVDRRRAGEPIAYLRGFVEWYGMELEVTRDVLIPRPETELLLEHALVLARETGARRLVDLGTGSGAVAVALAKTRPDADVVALDVNAEALAVARRNAVRHGVGHRISFLLSHLISSLTTPPDLIVANLPYLSDEMMGELGPEVRSEPRLALHGGRTGLELYGTLLEQLDDRGWSPSLALEIDPRQADLVRALWADRDPRIELDYAGRERIVLLRRD
jgi:release factor glutamine methyltransferase